MSRKAAAQGGEPEGAYEPLAFAVVHAFDVGAVKERLKAGNGGYEVVHESPGLELSVLVTFPRGR